MALTDSSCQKSTHRRHTVVNTGVLFELFGIYLFIYDFAYVSKRILIPFATLASNSVFLSSSGCQ